MEHLRLTLEVSSPSAVSAVDAARDPVERILDDLSFRMQFALPVGQAEALDVTPPIASGMERELGIFNPFPRWKFSRSQATEDQLETSPQLRSHYPALGYRSERALDWYIKGLRASSDADRFIFCWVALEVLERARDGRIQVPYTAPCGHEILACPECGVSTEKTVTGANIQAFLRELGLTAEDARTLWSVRQMVHGEYEFGSDKMQELPDYIQLLRAAVTRVLKATMGISSDQPPLVPNRGLWLGDVVLGGTRKISANDIG